MRKILLVLWLCHSSMSRATDAFDEARSAALTRPAETVALFEAQLPALSNTPAWHQRDWLVLSARAYTRLQRFTEAEQNLRRADALLSVGLSKTDLLLAAGFVNFMQQKYPAASYWYQCSARFDLPPVEQARVTMSLGQIAYIQQDFASAEQLFQQSLQAAEQYQQPDLQALLLNNLGLVRWRQQQFKLAVTLLKQAMFSYTQQRQMYSLQMSALNLLTVLISQQDWPAFDRYAGSIGNTINDKAPAELRAYLALLQAMRQAPQALSPADVQKLQQLAAPLHTPGLVQNAALLLRQAGAGSGITPAPAPDPQQDLRLPQLEPQCGPYGNTTAELQKSG